MRRIVCILILVLGMGGVAFGGDETGQLPKLLVFHSLSCHRCIEAKKAVMPVIEKKFKGKIAVEYHDIGDIENYKLLLGLQEKNGVKVENALPIFYFQGHFLSGSGEIRNSLEGLILNYGGDALTQKAGASQVDLIERFKSFKVFAVMGAGLVDGINPCAFTVIVFFISFLALQGYRRKELIVIGLSFIFAVFLTYLLVGIGLFEFLYRLEGFWAAAKVINISIGAISIILGILCLYDLIKFNKTQDTQGLILQLPQAIKNRIHKVVGEHYRIDKRIEGGNARRGLFKLMLSAFVTGFLVSMLEAVCTGQTYLPTISFILKSTTLKIPALFLLLLYNLMFILPLFVIFLCALFGATSEQFAHVLKKHMVTIKILMALLFFSLGAFLIWRG